MDFGSALNYLRAGKLVARRGWNGKEMFIYLVEGSQFTVNRQPLLGIFPEGTLVKYNPHIDMRTADGSCVPWLASQTDILAHDWVEVQMRQIYSQVEPQSFGKADMNSVNRMADNA